MSIKGKAFRLEKNTRANYMLPVRNPLKNRETPGDREKCARRYNHVELMEGWSGTTNT